MVRFGILKVLKTPGGPCCYSFKVVFLLLLLLLLLVVHYLVPDECVKVI